MNVVIINNRLARTNKSSINIKQYTFEWHSFFCLLNNNNDNNIVEVINTERYESEFQRCIKHNTQGE